MESLTAKLCAFARAWHSLQSDPTVFNDFLAFDMMGREEYENVSRLILKRFPRESENSVEYFNRKYFLPIVLSRSRFAEDRVKLLARSGKIQYVICGAGVDTFSFRNKNPDVEVFELDLLPTQSYKKNRIQELKWNVSEHVHFVAIDFSKDSIVERLVANGFDRQMPTVISILGASFRRWLPQVFRFCLTTCKKILFRIRSWNCGKSLRIVGKPWPKATWILKFLKFWIVTVLRWTNSLAKERCNSVIFWRKI